MRKNIRAILKEQLEALKPHIDSFPWEDKKSYGNWLAQTYNYVSHSTHLLALTSALCKPGERYHRHFISHLSEEAGHDKLAINDMKSLGLNNHPNTEMSSCGSLYQTQYYWIQHKHPLSFFGYMLMLEGTAVEFGPVMCERATKAHGPKAAAFLKVHSADDIDHVESDFDELDKLPDDVYNFAVENMLQTFGRYKMMLAECKADQMPAQKAS